MKYLLDSCVFLWMIDEYQNIPKKIQEEILNPLNELYLSSISITEITIKAQLGKLSIPKPYSEFLIEQRKLNHISSLSLHEDDITILEKLPDIHTDPFDRLLISQSIKNQLQFITPDKKIQRYPVDYLW